MDQPAFIARLRTELAVPSGLDRLQSQAALEHAFDPQSGSALQDLCHSDNLDFFGPLTLKYALGQDMLLPGRMPSGFLPFRGREWAAGLRRRAYRYVVLGVEAPKTCGTRQRYGATMLLRMTPRLLCEEAQGAGNDVLATLRLRSALMNRLQAELLADHLNRFAPSGGRAIAWKVVEGPAPDTSARAWLDATQPYPSLLRQESGEVQAWDLGRIATDGIATYRLENEPSQSSRQVFAMEPPRVILPPRFLLEGCLSLDDEVPPGTAGMAVRRLVPCQEAQSLCARIGYRNLKAPAHDAYRVTRSRAISDFLSYRPCLKSPTETYPYAFTRQEAEAAAAHLADIGWGEFTPRRVGEGGDFNPLGIEDMAPQYDIEVPGATPLKLDLFLYQ
jgi:hypothetical protein